MELIKNETKNNNQPLLSNEEITTRALGKLEKEFSFFIKNSTIEKTKSRFFFFDFSLKGHILEVIASTTKEQLILFCKENIDFSISILQSSKTFGDCLLNIADKIINEKGSHNQQQGFGVSDVTVFKYAVAFYFPNIKMNCYISLTLPENYITKGISKETADLVWQQIEYRQQELEQKTSEKIKKEKEEKEIREKKLKEQSEKSAAMVSKNEEPKEIQLSLF